MIVCMILINLHCKALETNYFDEALYLWCHLPLHAPSTESFSPYSVWLAPTVSTSFHIALVLWCCSPVVPLLFWAALLASNMVVTFHVPIFEIFLEDKKGIGDVASLRLSLHGVLLSPGGPPSPKFSRVPLVDVFVTICFFTGKGC